MSNQDPISLTKSLLRLDTVNPPGRERDCAHLIGAMLQELLDRLFAIVRLGDDRHVWLQANHTHDAFAHETVVVDAENPNGRCGHACDRSAPGGDDRGATARTAVP